MSEYTTPGGFDARATKAQSRLDRLNAARSTRGLRPLTATEANRRNELLTELDSLKSKADTERRTAIGLEIALIDDPECTNMKRSSPPTVRAPIPPPVKGHVVASAPRQEAPANFDDLPF